MDEEKTSEIIRIVRKEVKNCSKPLNVAIIKYYECICICGNKYFALTYRYDQGRNQHCGCKRIDKLKKSHKDGTLRSYNKQRAENALNKVLKYKNKYFKVVSLHCSEYKTMNSTYFKCLCSCGQYFIAIGNSLHKRKSCGCSYKKATCGEKSGLSLLTNKKAELIRKLYQSYSIKEISEMFDVHYQVVRRIVRNLSYKESIALNIPEQQPHSQSQELQLLSK